MTVYIPSGEGYFASALDIFTMSFQSLLATVDPEHVSITIIDNGCIPQATALLDKAVADGRIDRLVRNTVNRGKPDAVASELLASYEPFVTLADSDVLFLPGWLAAVEKVFNMWPRAGAVSPASQPKLAFYMNHATWAYGVLTGQLRRSKFVTDQDMEQFAHSVGNPTLYTRHEMDRQYALTRNGFQALVGAGHFVVTLRRRCYTCFEYKPRLEGTGHGMRAIDAPVDRNGWLRLSTTQAYVLHMGNTPEPWMHTRLEEILHTPSTPLASGSDGSPAIHTTGSPVPRALALVVAAAAKFVARVQVKIR